MSHGYVPVQWNRNKIVYDISLWVGIVIYIVMFMAISASLYPSDESFSPITLMIRALGSLAFVLITFILCIGPLARLNARFLPLLYNRRHLGVSMFIVALLHGALVLFWYHGFGAINPIESVFTSPGSFASSSDVPFQPFGFIALIIFFLMAATSHDYWNANLGAPVWKAIHMSVYVAYVLVVTHVAFGSMQDSATGILPILVVISVVIVGGLHLFAAFTHSGADDKFALGDWVDVGDWSSIAPNSGKVIAVGGAERVAVFRYGDDKLAAVSNVCQHQNGPLGEGCIIDGLITCPWHGFQYRPEDGCAPAPFTEKIATYELRVEGNRVLLNPKALPPGTARPVIEIKPVPPTKEVADAPA